MYLPKVLLTPNTVYALQSKHSRRTEPEEARTLPDQTWLAELAIVDASPPHVSLSISNYIMNVVVFLFKAGT
jgi:hypothetical protein